MATKTQKKQPKPSADAVNATAAAHATHEAKVKARVGTPKKHTGASIHTECQAQGIYPSFDGGVFAGYVDKRSKRKVSTTLPNVTTELHNDYIAAEKAAVEAARAKKNTKAVKVKAVKAAGSGRSGKLDGAQKIKLLVKENPKRPDTKAWNAFSCYKDGMTVADFLSSKHGTKADLYWDASHGFISIG